MRTIKDDKSKFLTQGNTNGVYGNMERHINDRSRRSEDAKKCFNRKPWYLECMVGANVK